MFLLLVFFLLYTSVASAENCPEEKKVGDTCYTRVAMADTHQYGCIENCTYKKTNGSDTELYCFKRGILPVTECEVITIPDVTCGDGMKVEFCIECPANEEGCTSEDCKFIGGRCVPAGEIMLKRIAGSSPKYFNKTFDEYEQGFSSNGEIWLGLEKIHNLTTSRSYGLIVKMTAWNDTEYIAVYDSFMVGPGDGYTLALSGFNSSFSTLGDAMAYHNGMKFSTWDRDQDMNEVSCSRSYNDGGWWFNWCHRTYPTGLNSDVPQTGFTYITWAILVDGLPVDGYWNNWKGSEFILVPSKEDLLAGTESISANSCTDCLEDNCSKCVPVCFLPGSPPCIACIEAECPMSECLSGCT